MMRQTLRDRNQHVIGYIDVEFSGRQCLRDSNNHVLGYYEPSRNQTVDSNYHVIGNGNLLTTLLWFTLFPSDPWRFEGECLSLAMLNVTESLSQSITWRGRRKNEEAGLVGVRSVSLLVSESTHARDGTQCRQKGCERGYYHLHRQLNESLVFHSFVRVL